MVMTSLHQGKEDASRAGLKKGGTWLTKCTKDVHKAMWLPWLMGFTNGELVDLAIFLHGRIEQNCLQTLQKRCFKLVRTKLLDPRFLVEGIVGNFSLVAPKKMDTRLRSASSKKMAPLCKCHTFKGAYPYWGTMLGRLPQLRLCSPAQGPSLSTILPSQRA